MTKQNKKTKWKEEDAKRATLEEVNADDMDFNMHTGAPFDERVHFKNDYTLGSLLSGQGAKKQIDDAQKQIDDAQTTEEMFDIECHVEEVVAPEFTHRLSAGVNETYYEQKITKDQFDILVLMADSRMDDSMTRLYRINEVVFKLNPIVQF